MNFKHNSLFYNKSNNYEKFRPEYPKNLIQRIFDYWKISNSHLSVAEFGCGTGKLTKNLQVFTDRLYAIDSDKDMLDFVKKRFHDNPKIIPILASAEASTLKDSSIDLVFAAQAFHHFDSKKAVDEFIRVLRPEGKICLLWYFSDMKQSISKSIQKCFYKFGHELKQSQRLSISEHDISLYFSKMKTKFTKLGLIEQKLNYDDFIGSMVSSSYAPVSSNAHYYEYIQQMEKIFNENESNGNVTCRFFVHVYTIEHRVIK